MHVDELEEEDTSEDDVDMELYTDYLVNQCADWIDGGLEYEQTLLS
jgi:hypothetical protein